MIVDSIGDLVVVFYTTRCLMMPSLANGISLLFGGGGGVTVPRDHDALKPMCTIKCQLKYFIRLAPTSDTPVEIPDYTSTFLL